MSHRDDPAHFSQSFLLARTSLSARLLFLLFFASAAGNSTEHASIASSSSVRSRLLRPQRIPGRADNTPDAPPRYVCKAEYEE